MSFNEIRSTDVPCFLCKPPVRHEGCHGTCEKYLAYRDKKDQENESRRINSDLDIRQYLCHTKSKAFR